MGSDSFVGGDVASMRRVASELRAAGDRVTNHAETLSASLRAVRWDGDVAAAFASRWRGSHRARLDSAASFLRDTAVLLERSADEQERASAPDAGVAGPVPPVAHTGPSPGASTNGSAGANDAPSVADSVVDHAATALGATGLVADELRDLREHGVEMPSALAELLASDGFDKALGALGTVVDVHQFVEDVVTDLAEHPEIEALDDRLVHALADAAGRFAVAEGADKAVDLLATAMLNTLMPGIGAGVYAVARPLLKQLLAMAIEPLIDGLDGAFDTLGDLAVDAWHVIEDVALGLAAKVVDGAVMIADTAVELADGVVVTFDAAGNAAGMTFDAAAAGLGWGFDTMVDLGDSAKDFAGDTKDFLVDGATDGIGAVGDLFGAIT